MRSRTRLRAAAPRTADGATERLVLAALRQDSGAAVAETPREPGRGAPLDILEA